LAIAACGSNAKPAATTTTSAASSTGTKTVEIYSSLPDSGAQAASSHQIEAGIKFALGQAHKKAGTFRVQYKQLCDTTPPREKGHAPTSRSKVSNATRNASRKCTGNWDPTAVAHNAEMAAQNPKTIAYIGDLNSGATELSLPILNEAGIVQVTPGSGYPGLTNAVKSPKGLAITSPGEPGKYYPRGLGARTLLRMIPNDLVQASAALDVLQRTGCQKFTAWNFGSDVESTSLLHAVIATAPKYKMDYVAPPPMPAKTSYYQYAKAIVAPTGIHCAVMVGQVTRAAGQLTTYLRTQLTPAPPIVGTSGFCNAGWVRAIPKADVKNVVPGLSCLTAALPVNRYLASASFIKAFHSAYHRAPTAYNLYGYAATEMLLRALKDTDTAEDTRSQVLTEMVDDIAPNAVDTFSFDLYGNLLTDDDYGVAVFKHGVPGQPKIVSIGAKHLLSSG
jgi:branched-chain amino acid transport system substrate-binding protein